MGQTKGEVQRVGKQNRSIWLCGQKASPPRSLRPLQRWLQVWGGLYLCVLPEAMPERREQGGGIRTSRQANTPFRAPFYFN